MGRNLRGIRNLCGTLFVVVLLTVGCGVLKAPSDLSAQAISPTEIRLDWNDGSTDESGFQVDVRGGDIPALLISLPANTETTIVGSLKPGTTYTCKVRAYKQLNRGPIQYSSWSNEAQATTPEKSGVPDETFGTDGVVLTEIGISAEAKDVAVKADGKIVAVGTAKVEEDKWVIAVAQYLSDGSPDTNFGTGGVVTTSFQSLPGVGNAATSVAIQPDGKIVAAGYNGENLDFTFVRYNINGSPDNDFGTAGIATIAIGSNESLAYGAALQPDGKIVAVGYAWGEEETTDFAIARMNSDGTPDGSFGDNGTVMTHIGGFDIAKAVAFQPERGRILVAGQSYNFDTRTFTPVAMGYRYDNGALDLSFGDQGIAVVGTDGVATGIGLQQDGAIIVTGSSGPNYRAVRLDPDGHDPTYNFNHSFPQGQGDARALGMVVQPDDKVVIAGYTTGIPTGTDDFALMRVGPDGGLDPTFGPAGDGRVMTNIGNDDHCQAVAIQPDGKIVAAGSSVGQGGARKFCLVRYR